MIAVAALALWSATVTLESLERGQAQVELKLAGMHQGEVSLCFGRSRAARFASGLTRDPADEDCLRARSEGPVLRTSYRLDLGALCARSHDPDDCAAVPSGFALSDKALLALPANGSAEVSVEFALPAGAGVAAPWEMLPGPRPRFRTSADQVRAGSYLALGKLDRLEDIEVEGGAFQLALFASKRRSTPAGVRRWLVDPARATARFWGGIPTGRTLLLLVPVPGSERGGIFGSVLHQGTPSAVLYFGADAPDDKLLGGWVAFHELFHAGQPTMSKRTAWFIEGTATYYQDVLRARSGARSSEEMWADLGASLLEHCAPQDGMSLAEESRELRRTHNYPHLYWMGACTAFRLDVRMRELSSGKRSLDHAMRALAALGHGRQLDESEVLRVLDESSGGLASELVRMTKDPRPAAEELKRLGVELKGDRAVLHDDAPLAGVRKAIF